MSHRITSTVALTLAALALAAACQPAQVVNSDSADNSLTTPTTHDTAAAPDAPVVPPQQFDSPEAAVQALVNAVNNPGKQEIHQIFGSDLSSFMSGDPVEDQNDFKAFAEKCKENIRIVKKSDALANLVIGKDDWPFAIPLVKDADGKWSFDTIAGRTEVLARRIGNNELDTIAFMHAYVQAQRDYAAKFHDGSDVLKFAQRLVSSTGKQDGLYYPSSDPNDQSPFGPLAAEASNEGYGPVSGSRKNPSPYHGYYFHILKAQGPHAPGGAYNYVINGNMIGGFALVASPAQYDQSGVMTFIVSHNGKVYQQDLGANTAELAPKITVYDPDNSWELVK